MALPLRRTGGITPEPDESDVSALLEAVYHDFGYDFRDYARGSVQRRIGHLMSKLQLPDVRCLYDKLLEDPAFKHAFLDGMVVHVSSMFRDPDFFRMFRRQVAPMLATYPFIRVWQAGCAMGEEVYSLAILLREEGLYEKTLIYATDISGSGIQRAKSGLYARDLMPRFSENYLAAGGKRRLSDYYTAAGAQHVMFQPGLKRRVVFAQHNLATDGSFNEFNVILCRNVMIYFNTALQRRVHSLIYRSLGLFGVLGLGLRESLRFTPHERSYEELDREQKLFRKVA